MHVELSNPGDDADEMEAVLRAAGFEVARVELGELGRQGAASVVDVSQTGAEVAIDALLARGAHPVVRVGDAAHREGVLSRPVGHDALLVAVRRALAQVAHVEGVDQAVTVTQHVGRTFQPGIEMQALDPGLSLAEGAEEVAEARPSERLAAALRQVGGEALITALSRGQRDGALALAPDVLFDFPLGPGDGPDQEHDLSILERALPDLSDSDPPPPVSDPPPNSAAPAAEADPSAREGWLRLEDSILGTPDPTGSFRSGQTGPLGMVRLLWRIAELGLDLELDANFSGERLLVRFLAGGVQELRGNSYLRFVRALDLPPSAQSEREAQALVETEMLAGRLSRFEIDRGLRLAGEAQLVELALAPEASFTLRSLSVKEARRLAESPAPLARPALALVVREARRELGVDTLERLAGGSPRVRLTPEARGRMQQAEVEPELRATLLRNDGGSYGDILREVGEGVGVAGLLCILAVLEAVRFVRDSARPG